MRTVAVILIAAAAPALAGFGSVVSSFHKGDAITSRGLAWADGKLVTTNMCSSGNHKWREYTPAGSLVATFDGPETYNAHIGADYDGSYYWTGSWAEDRIYRFASGGSVVSSFGAGWPNGVAWDGQYIWWSSYEGDWFYKCRTGGSIVTSWRVSAITDSGDLAWDGIYLWCADLGSGYVYRLNTVGAVTRSFAGPGDEIYGCAFDGKYLWVTDTTIDNQTTFYRVDIEYSGPAVEPASIGRVKTLFR